MLPSGDLEELVRQTADSALLLLPFRFRDNLIQMTWDGPSEDILKRLPTTILINAACDLDLEAEPEEGRAAEIAGLHDALEDLQTRLRKAEKDAIRTAETTARCRARLATLLEAETGFIDLQVKKALEHEVENAERVAEKSRRRLLKLEAKLEQTEQEAIAAGVSLTADDKDHPAKDAPG